MRYCLFVLAAAACGGKDAAPTAPPPPRLIDAPVVDAGSALPAHASYPDLAAALLATIPADARVIGFGELHARTDRASVRSSLAAFTAALPSIGDRMSDLVIETWLVDPKCGKSAAVATSKMESEVKRPAATKSEIAQLADAAKAAKVQAHAMTVSCDDYATLAPPAGAPDPIAMLTLTTRELQRIATSAVLHRDKDPGHRPWIALYGGALHNDRFPDSSVAEWSYAGAVDELTGGKFVEVDIIVPELALADPSSAKQPWFPLAAAAGRDVTVWTRGERSFVIVLAKS